MPDISILMPDNFTEFLSADRMLQVIRAAIMLLFALPIILIGSRWVKNYFSRKISPQQGMVFGKIVKYGGLILIFLTLLNEFGFKLTTLLGAAGIVGIALGFASQTSVSNIISGFFLIAEKPFEVGDIITVNNTTGIVLSIDMLSIKLRTFDNKFVRIPNESILKTEVINITRFPIRRLDLNIGVAYKEDLDRVRKILMEVARDNPLCLNEPAPLIIFNQFGSSSIDLLFLTWAVKSDYLPLKNSIPEQIKKRFDAEGVEIPFPHITFYTGSLCDPLPIKIVDEGRKNPLSEVKADETVDLHDQ